MFPRTVCSNPLGRFLQWSLGQWKVLRSCWGFIQRVLSGCGDFLTSPALSIRSPFRVYGGTLEVGLFTPHVQYPFQGNLEVVDAQSTPPSHSHHCSTASLWRAFRSPVGNHFVPTLRVVKLVPEGDY